MNTSSNYDAIMFAPTRKGKYPRNTKNTKDYVKNRLNNKWREERKEHQKNNMFNNEDSPKQTRSYMTLSNTRYTNIKEIRKQNRKNNRKLRNMENN